MFTEGKERLKIRENGGFSELVARIEVNTDQAVSFRGIAKSHYEADGRGQLYPKVGMPPKSMSVEDEKGKILYDVSQGRIRLHTRRGYLDAKIREKGETKYLTAKAGGETGFVLDFFKHLQEVYETVGEENTGADLPGPF